MMFFDPKEHILKVLGQLQRPSLAPTLGLGQVLKSPYSTLLSLSLLYSGPVKQLI